MRQKLTHPLWVHLPVLLVLIAGAVAALNHSETTTLAYHKYHGRHSLGVDAYFVPLMGLFYIGLSVLADELWARQETRKTFNWLSLIDDALVGFLAGTLLVPAGHMTMLRLVPIGTVAMAIVLELLRPYRPSEQRAAHEDTSALERQITESKQQGKAWVYWDVQNPTWWTTFVYGAGMALVSVGILTLRHVPWVAGSWMVLGISILALNGGVVRTLVTSDRVEVRMGVFRLLRMRVADVASADVHTFSPLREFGGYGIRYGKGIKAFFLRGNRGVLVTATSGKKYLIGSDHPERLAAAINATMGQQNG